MLSRGQALGLTVRYQRPLAGLAPGTGASELDVREMLLEELDRRWEGASPTPIHERRDADGELVLRILRDERLGHRIDAPSHGYCVVAADGRSLLWADAVEGDGAPLRLLYGQAVPLAATLQGFEVLHAGAVAGSRGALALVGPSGAGKSTLVGQVVAAGGRFVTDDALALTVRGDTVLVHPGPAFASFPDEELAALTATGRRALGAVLGRSDKPHFAPPALDRPVPLRALALVSRDDDRPPTLAPAPGTLPELLGSTFVPYVRDAERLARQFDLCTKLVATVPAWRLSLPGGARSSDVARLLLDALGSEVGLATRHRRSAPSASS